MKLSSLALGILITLSTGTYANNWMKLLELSDASRLRAEQAREPAVPVAGPISSEFGPRVHPVSGKNTTHKGVDVAAVDGEPFVAIATGLVIESEFQPGFGNTILLEHENGLTSRYAHASELEVVVGDRVEKNQLLGRVGQTGLATGPHLHLEVHLDGNPVDPLTLLSLTKNTQFSKAGNVVHDHTLNTFESRVSDAVQKEVQNTPNGRDLAVGEYIKTNRSLWSIAKQLSRELRYPSLQDIMNLLVENNPRSFPTSDANYRLASEPLFIPDSGVFQALLPDVVLTKDPIWLISQKLKTRYGSDASIYQIMYSLKSKNPQAFVENNINRRLASVPLKLTTPEEFSEVSHRQAYDAFIREIKA